MEVIWWSSQLVLYSRSIDLFRRSVGSKPRFLTCAPNEVLQARGKAPVATQPPLVLVVVPRPYRPVNVFEIFDLSHRWLRHLGRMLTHPVLSPTTVATRLRLGHTPGRKPTVSSFKSQPCGNAFCRKQRKARIYTRGMRFHCHSTAFYRFWMVHCVITMGNTLNSSIFDTCRLSCICIKFPCDYTWCGPIAI